MRYRISRVFLYVVSLASLCMAALGCNFNPADAGQNPAGHVSPTSKPSQNVGDKVSGVVGAVGEVAGVAATIPGPHQSYALVVAVVAKSLEGLISALNSRKKAAEIPQPAPAPTSSPVQPTGPPAPVPAAGPGGPSWPPPPIGQQPPFSSSHL